MNSKNLLDIIFDKWSEINNLSKPDRLVLGIEARNELMSNITQRTGSIIYPSILFGMNIVADFSVKPMSFKFMRGEKELPDEPVESGRNLEWSENLEELKW